MKKTQSTNYALIAVGVLLGVILPLLFINNRNTGIQLTMNIMRGVGFVLLIIAAVRGYREKKSSQQ